MEFDCNGKRTLPWSALNGLWFRRKSVAPHTTDGAHVRVALRTGISPETDVLDGVVTALDDRALSLKHPLLGDLKIEQNGYTGSSRCFSARAGDRQCLPSPRRPAGLFAAIATPHARGNSTETPIHGRVTAGRRPPGAERDGIKRRQETDSRALVYLNGERLADLNRLVDKAIAHRAAYRCRSRKSACTRATMCWN